MTEMFAVHDAPAEAWIDPFPAPTLQVAIRGFQEACQTEGHQFNKFPTDYTLFHVGTFDASVGEMVGWKVPRKIAQATNFVQHGVPGVLVDERIEKVREVMPTKEAANA